MKVVKNKTQKEKIEKNVVEEKNLKFDNIVHTYDFKNKILFDELNEILVSKKHKVKYYFPEIYSGIIFILNGSTFNLKTNGKCTIINFKKENMNETIRIMNSIHDCKFKYDEELLKIINVNLSYRFNQKIDIEKTIEDLEKNEIPVKIAARFPGKSFSCDNIKYILFQSGVMRTFSKTLEKKVILDRIEKVSKFIHFNKSL